MMSDLFSLEELRVMLKKAKKADAELKQFGAGRHKYQWNPAASLEKIEKFEQEAGVSLPEDCRKFLLQAGDGGAGPFLDGEEGELRQRYRNAGTEEERLLALISMNKFPALSKDSRDFIGDVLEEWTATEDI